MPFHEKPPVTGKELSALIARCERLHRQPLVDEFLYPRRTTFLNAEPGCGKTTVALQIAVSVAAGVPVFDLLAVRAAGRVYYIAFETDEEDFGESLSLIRRHIPFDPANLVIDTEAAGLNVAASSKDVADLYNQEALTECVLRYQPVLIILDPLYMCVAGDLAKSDAAGAAVNWVNRLGKRSGAAVLVVHHTHRERQNAVTGETVKERDRVYGSQWLRAHPTITWEMTANDDHSGVELVPKKDRYKVCRRRISLLYDEHKALCFPAGGSFKPIIVRLVELLRTYPVGAELDSATIAEALDCNKGSLKPHWHNPDVRALVERVERGRRTWWRRHNSMKEAAA